MHFEDTGGMDTIAGWIHYQYGTDVQSGDEIKQGDNVWIVSEIDNFQIKQIILKQQQ
ncbi:hypothetical protein D3C80_1779810 [compost metagenome]